GAAGGPHHARERAGAGLGRHDPPARGPGGALVSPRVLVVDDDPDVVEAVGVVLEDDGYRVETATDGPAALRSVLEAPPDLIVLDVRMPRLNGRDFCVPARRHAPNRDVPVRFLTL